MQGTSHANLTRLRHIAKTLGDEVRLLILTHLKRYKHLSFQTIVEITGKAKSTVSYHLTQLLEAGIIEEAEVDHDGHKKMKFYRYSLDDREFQLPTDIDTDERKLEVLEMFEFGRRYLKLEKELLDYAISYTDTIYDDLLEVLTSSPEGQRSEEQERFIQEGFAYLGKLIRSSEFITFPLNAMELREYADGLIKYNRDFLEKLGRKEYIEHENLFWIIEASLPMDDIREIPRK